jgi:predicted alpha/beta superfamily hydrolase
MKQKLLLFMLILASPIFGQITHEEITSKKLGTSRNLTISLPAYYNEDKDKKYPLILLLDGDYLLDPFAGTLKYANYWDDLPEAIIVAIDESGEQRDNDTQVSELNSLPTGTGEQFYQFIATELVPYLEKKYRVSPFKVVAGHDATAGFINFFLYKDDPVFNGFICFSPELSEHMDTVLPERMAKLKKPVFYYLATAGGDVDKLQKSTKALNDSLQVIKNANFRYYFENLGGASHYSLVTYGIPGALYSIFSSYQPISTIEYKEKIVTLPSGYVDYLKKKYSIIEKDLGVPMRIRLNDFKAIEAAILKNTRYDELKDLASLARKNYPKTTLGEYYDGLYYEMKGELRKAKKTYLNSYSYEGIGDWTKDFMMKKAEGLNTD